jgi:hypothetical protein
MKKQSNIKSFNKRNSISLEMTLGKNLFNIGCYKPTLKKTTKNEAALWAVEDIPVWNQIQSRIGCNSEEETII